MTVSNAPINTITDKSGVVAAGGVSQTLVAANSKRRRLIIQNPSTAALQGIAGAESLWISYVGAAAVGGGNCIEIQSGTSWDDGVDCPTGQAVTITATTINHKFVCYEGQ